MINGTVLDPRGSTSHLQRLAAGSQLSWAPTVSSCETSVEKSTSWAGGIPHDARRRTAAASSRRPHMYTSVTSPRSTCHTHTRIHKYIQMQRYSSLTLLCPHLDVPKPFLFSAVSLSPAWNRNRRPPGPVPGPGPPSRSGGVAIWPAAARCTPPAMEHTHDIHARHLPAVVSAI